MTPDLRNLPQNFLFNGFFGGVSEEWERWGTGMTQPQVIASGST